MEPRNTRHVKNTRPSHPPFFPLPVSILFSFVPLSISFLSLRFRIPFCYFITIFLFRYKIFYVLQFLKFTNLFDHLNLLRLREKENYFQLLLSFSSFKIFANVNETNNIGKFVICS